MKLQYFSPREFAKWRNVSLSRVNKIIKEILELSQFSDAEGNALRGEELAENYRQLDAKKATLRSVGEGPFIYKIRINHTMHGKRRLNVFYS